MSKEIKAVGYIRVSTQEQTEGFSLDNQKQDIEEYCKYKKYELLGIFEDGGKSGKNIKGRPEFLNMIDFVESGNANAIIIWKASRIARSLYDFIKIVAQAEEKGYRLISIQDNFDSSDPQSKVVMVIQGLVADLERDNLKTQVRGGMKKRAIDGLWNGGPTPYGYNHNKKEKTLEINKEESEIVKEIFHLYLHKNWGYSKIARHLNNLGYRTKKNNSFGINSVKGILQNPLYCGKIRWERYVDYEDKKRQGYNENFIYVDGKHPAIVSEDLYNTIQEKIKTNLRHGNSGKPSNYLLSGLLRCPACGYGMAVQKVVRKKYNSTNYYYTCGSYQNKKGCSPNTQKMENVDNQFIKVMNEYVKTLTLDTVKSCLDNDKTEEINIISQKINTINKRIKKLETSQKNISKGFEEEDAPFSLLVKQLKEIEEKIDKHKETLNLLQIEQSKKGQNLNPHEVYETLKKFDFIMGVADKQEKRELVKALVKEVHINNNGEITEIIMKFNQSLKISREKGENKSFIITCDTVPPY